MRVKVIDSNSSSYRSKVTKPSAIIRQKLITITASQVIFQNARRKWFTEKSSPSHTSLWPAPKCSLSNQQPPHAFLGGGRDRDPARHSPHLPQPPRDSPCSGVFVVLTLWVSDPHRRTLCSVTGVFWPHLSLSETMRRPGKHREEVAKKKTIMKTCKTREHSCFGNKE